MVAARPQVLDQFGKPYRLDGRQAERVAHVRAFYERKLREIRASYDATRDGPSFANHWSNADHRSPNSAASYSVRKSIRSRSRFELIENNPYLAGIALTICNDFTGGGPKLQITDRRISKKTKRFIEEEVAEWKDAIKYRQKLWRLRMGRLVDGEGFKRAYVSHKLDTPVKINFRVIECDHCTSQGVADAKETKITETDGIRFDGNHEPTHYFLLDEHPGASIFDRPTTGRWYDARFVSHWFRKVRAWDRGIPEAAPSLPLCALLRRYTLAVVKAAETNASYSAVLETTMPSSTGLFGEDDEADDVFDTIPITHDAFTILPFGTKFSQFNNGQPTITYDPFVSALLREIARPLLVPFNYAAGSSKDSNMSTAVVDGHIYKQAGGQDRKSCDDDVVDPDFALWWSMAVLIPGYLPPDARQLGRRPPRHRQRWDRIGLDHTDPYKVANSLKTAQEAGHLTDRDVQEGYHNRSIEDWQEEIREQQKFREEVGMPVGGGVGDGEPDPADDEAGDDGADAEDN